MADYQQIKQQYLRQTKDASGREVFHVELPRLTAKLEDIANTPMPEWGHRRASQSNSHGTEWYGTPSYDDMLSKLRSGWPDGTEEMKKLSMLLRPCLPMSQRPKFSHRASVVPRGPLAINVPAVIMGRPDTFVGQFRSNQVTKGNKIIRVCCNQTTSAGVDAKTIMGRGAAVLCLIDTLRAAGKSVDITAVFCVTGGYDQTASKTLITWHIAPAGDLLNLNTLAMAIVNPSGQRRALFSGLELLPMPWGQSYHYGYGLPQPMKTTFPEDYKRYDVVADSECAYLGGRMLLDWSRPEHQIAWVKEQLTALGIIAPETDGI